MKCLILGHINCQSTNDIDKEIIEDI